MNENFETDRKSFEFKDGDFKNHILNEKNIPITQKFINDIFKQYDINYKVKNLENFQLAMTHISYLNCSNITEKTSKILQDVIPISDEDKPHTIPLCSKCYGRLEYLGDAIIHMIIAEYLFNRYKTEQEGFLTNLRMKIEKGDTLSKLSKKIGLHKYALIARNIEQSNGRIMDRHLTEDIFESFFGALFLESDFDICKKLFISILEKEIDMSEFIKNDDNYISMLDRHFNKLKLGYHPIYLETSEINVKRGCQDEKIFTSEVRDKSNNVLGIGKGKTKKQSRQNAAYDALVNLQVITEDNDSDYFGEESDDSDNDSNDESNNSNDKTNSESDDDSDSDSDDESDDESGVSSYYEESD